MISAGPTIVGGVAVGAEGDDAAGDQAGDPERRQHAAGRQQQLGEQQAETDQGDDDERFHRSIIRSRSA